MNLKVLKLSLFTLKTLMQDCKHFILLIFSILKNLPRFSYVKASIGTVYKLLATIFHDLARFCYSERQMKDLNQIYFTDSRNRPKPFETV